jgi:hypothetical protein
MWNIYGNANPYEQEEQDEEKIYKSETLENGKEIYYTEDSLYARHKADTEKMD